MKSETLSLKTVINKLVFVNSYYLVKHQKKQSVINTESTKPIKQ